MNVFPRERRKIPNYKPLERRFVMWLKVRDVSKEFLNDQQLVPQVND